MVALAVGAAPVALPAGVGATAAGTFTERVVVDAGSPEGARTDRELLAGGTYTVTARGTYRLGDGRPADAECATYPPDGAYRRSRLGVVQAAGDPDPYDLYVDGAPVDWAPASPDLLGCDTTAHAYQVRFVPGRTGRLHLQVFVPEGGATGSLVVDVSGPAAAAEPPATTTATSTPTTAPPPATTVPPSVAPQPARPAPVPTPAASARTDPPAAPTGSPPSSAPSSRTPDTIPPELLEPPPVVEFPTSTAPAQPAGGYALYPTASPGEGLRDALPLAMALVALGALASTAHAAMRRRVLAPTGAGRSARLPRPSPSRRRPSAPPAATPATGRTLRPDALRSRIAEDGTCTCPSCARRWEPRRRRRH